MNGKIVATVVVLSLVAAGIGFAIVQSDKVDETKDNNPLLGTWYLTYIEKADLIVGDEYLENALDCDISSRNIDPMDGAMTLRITETDDCFFRGDLQGTGIHGTYQIGSLGDLTFRYDASITSATNHTFTNQGVVRENMLAISSTEFDVEGRICSVQYALYVNDVNSSISPMDNKVEFNIRYEHVFTRLHSESDFLGGDPRGTPYGFRHDYAKSNTMISLFNIFDKDANQLGIEAITSLGIRNDGAVFATVASHMKAMGEWHEYYGDACMINGKLRMIQFVGSPINGFHFIETEYNVPYYAGKIGIPLFMEGNYSGKVTTWYNDQTTSIKEISKSFTQSDRTIYGFERYQETEYIWFGGFDGRSIFEFEVRGVDKTGEVLAGILMGHMEADGTIVLAGTLYDKDSTSVVAVKYELSPKAK